MQLGGRGAERLLQNQNANARQKLSVSSLYSAVDTNAKKGTSQIFNPAAVYPQASSL